MKVGRFLELDAVIRKIAQNLIDVENTDVKLANSAKNICKLLYYTEKNPIEQPDQKRIDSQNPHPTFESLDESYEFIMNKRVLLVPRVPAEDEMGAFIVVHMDDFTLSSNKEFKPSRVVFDILVHADNWLLNNSLRPFVIMQEIDTIFNGRKLAIGQLEFFNARSVVLTPTKIGYTMVYKNAAFN